MGIAIFILSMMMAFVTVLYFIHKIALNWLLSEAIDDKPSRLREIRICRLGLKDTVPGYSYFHCRF